MPAYLDTIVAAHRAGPPATTATLDAARGRRPRRAGPGAPVRRGHRPGRRPRRGMAVISEIKRRSPSKGDLDPALDPAAVAADYEAGEPPASRSSPTGSSSAARPRTCVPPGPPCALPVLRKDFTVSALDVCDARIMGADAVLLIVAALTDAELASFLDLARRCSLTALVEVHDELELERALDAGADLIGVNQRDLRTFEVDQRRALGLGESIPADGGGGGRVGDPRTPTTSRRLADAGYRAVLVGETPGPLGRPARRRWPSCSGPARDAPAAQRGDEPDDERDGRSSRSAGSPPRPTRCWPWAWGRRPSGSSSPPRPGRWPRRRWPTSSSGCRTRP